MSRRGAPYARVSPTFWQSARRKKWTNDVVLVGVYLLTCRHKTTEGLYEIPLEYMLADLPKGWKPARIKKALEQLASDGFALYDHEKSVVLLPDAMEHQRPDNTNQQTAAIRKITALPATDLWPLFMDAASKYAPDFHTTLMDHFPQDMRQGMGQGMAHPQALSQTPTQDSYLNSVPRHSIPPSPDSIAQDSNSCSNHSRSSAPLDEDDLGPF